MELEKITKDYEHKIAKWGHKSISSRRLAPPRWPCVWRLSSRGTFEIFCV
jgi:hypothetical protein